MRQFAERLEMGDELQIFDPKATEDQEGDVGIITFNDKWFTDAATGKTWTA